MNKIISHSHKYLNQHKTKQHEDRLKKKKKKKEQPIQTAKTHRIDEKDHRENLVTVDRCCFTPNGSSSAPKLVNKNKKIRKIIAMKSFFLAAIHPSMNINKQESTEKKTRKFICIMAEHIPLVLNYWNLKD